MKRYERSYIWFSPAVVRLKYVLNEKEKIRAISVTSPVSLSIRLFFCYLPFWLFAINSGAPGETLLDILMLPFNPAVGSEILLSRLIFFGLFIPWMYQILGRKIVVTDKRLVVVNFITGQHRCLSLRKVITADTGRFGSFLFYRHLLIIDESDKFINFKGVMNYDAIFNAINQSVSENCYPSYKQPEGAFVGYKEKNIRKAEVKAEGRIYYIGNEYKTELKNLKESIKEILARYDNKADYIPLFNRIKDVPALKVFLISLYVRAYISPSVWGNVKEILGELDNKIDKSKESSDTASIGNSSFTRDSNNRTGSDLSSDGVGSCETSSGSSPAKGQGDSSMQGQSSNVIKVQFGK